MLQEWVRDQTYTEMIVSDRMGEIYTGGWVPSTVRSSEAAGANNSDSTTLKKDIPTEGEDLFNREVRFLDKEYFVYMNVYLEYRWKAVLDNLKLMLAALIFLILVLVYNRRVLARIIKLSDDVNRIRTGELDLEIDPGDEDEIGALAMDIDQMRSSIMERMNREKEVISPRVMTFSMPPVVKSTAKKRVTARRPLSPARYLNPSFISTSICFVLPAPSIAVSFCVSMYFSSAPIRVSMTAATKKQTALAASSGAIPIPLYRNAETGTITADSVSSMLCIEYAFW